MRYDGRWQMAMHFVRSSLRCFVKKKKKKKKKNLYFIRAEVCFQKWGDEVLVQKSKIEARIARELHGVKSSQVKSRKTLLLHFWKLCT